MPVLYRGSAVPKGYMFIFRAKGLILHSGETKYNFTVRKTFDQLHNSSAVWSSGDCSCEHRHYQYKRTNNLKAGKQKALLAK